MGTQYKDSDYVHVSDLSLLKYDIIFKLSYVREKWLTLSNEIQNTFIRTKVIRDEVRKYEVTLAPNSHLVFCDILFVF